MTFVFINKTDFNRGQGPLPCMLSLLGNKGCHAIQTNQIQTLSNLEESNTPHDFDVNCFEKIAAVLLIGSPSYSEFH